MINSERPLGTTDLTVVTVSIRSSGARFKTSFASSKSSVFSSAARKDRPVSTTLIGTLSQTDFETFFARYSTAYPMQPSRNFIGRASGPGVTARDRQSQQPRNGIIKYHPRNKVDRAGCALFPTSLRRLTRGGRPPPQTPFEVVAIDAMLDLPAHDVLRITWGWILSIAVAVPIGSQPAIPTMRCRGPLTPIAPNIELDLGSSEGIRAGDNPGLDALGIGIGSSAGLKALPGHEKAFGAVVPDAR